MASGRFFSPRCLIFRQKVWQNQNNVVPLYYVLA
nr:MAG TPA: hypothetical protein [Caudoviricetes sp.]